MTVLTVTPKDGRQPVNIENSLCFRQCHKLLFDVWDLTANINAKKGYKSQGRWKDNF